MPKQTKEGTKKSKINKENKSAKINKAGIKYLTERKSQYTNAKRKKKCRKLQPPSIEDLAVESGVDRRTLSRHIAREIGPLLDVRRRMREAYRRKQRRELNLIYSKMVIEGEGLANMRL